MPISIPIFAYLNIFLHFSIHIFDTGDEFGDESEELEVEMLMSRFEDLMERRPLLLNSVLLRQNPHNVAEWQKRVTLLEDKPQEIVATYTEAVQTVDPKLAVGKLQWLWVNFAKFYEKNKQLDDARIILEKATHVSYLKVNKKCNFL